MNETNDFRGGCTATSAERSSVSGTTTARSFSILRLLGWSLALGLLFWSLRTVEPAEVLRSIRGVGPALLLVLLPQFIGLTLETWGWRAVLCRVGHFVSFRALWGIRVGTEAVGQLLPGGVLLGESIKPTLLQRHCGLPIPVGVAATAHRKYVRLLAHGLYVTGGTWLGIRALGSASEQRLGCAGLELLLFVVGACLFLAALTMAQVVGRGRLAGRVHRVLLALPVPPFRRALERRTQVFHEADRRADAFFELGPRDLALPVGMCTAAWFCEALEAWLILELLGAALGFDQVIGFELVIALARQIVFVLPAGLGLQEAGYMTAFSTLSGSSLVSLGAAFVVIKRLKELCWAAFGLGVLGCMRIGAAPGAARRLVQPV